VHLNLVNFKSELENTVSLTILGERKRNIYVRIKFYCNYLRNKLNTPHND
jgi:hypothetical protein